MTTTKDQINSDLFDRAHAAGMAAGEAHVPTPMIVGSAIGLSNTIDPSQPIYHVPQGVCGFAWVNIRPGNSSFARWCTKNSKGRPNSYEGGVNVWVHQFGQSMECKEAYARAFAAVLTEAGIKAYAGSRMD